jgi:predicted SAM-dependent methyltransferase
MQINFSPEELMAFGQQLLDPNPNFRNQQELAYYYAAKLFQANDNNPDVLALMSAHLIRRQELHKALAMAQHGLATHAQHTGLLRNLYHIQRHLGAHADATHSLIQLYEQDAAGRAIKHYLDNQTNWRVVLGPGEHYYEGWLNLDLIPHDPRFIWFDARAPLWLPDESADIVFSEHMIEHISYADGVALLTDIFRVLKPGGMVRIATPDLARTCALAGERSAIQQNYVNYINQTFGGHYNNQASFAINNMFFTYNHAFVYDAATLRDSFERAGFVDITEQTPRQSDYPMMRNLEMHHLLGHDWIEDYQTLVLEARRP